MAGRARERGQRQEPPGRTTLHQAQTVSYPACTLIPRRSEDHLHDGPCVVPPRLRDAFQALPKAQFERPLVEFAQDDLPPLEVLCSTGHRLSAQEQQDQFLADVQPGCRLCAQVRSASAIMLDVELVCTLGEFKRLLINSALGRVSAGSQARRLQFKILHDRSAYAYHTGDLIEGI